MMRQQSAIGIVTGMAVLFFAGLHRFEGDPLAQCGVAVAYVIAVLVVMTRANRHPA